MTGIRRATPPTPSPTPTVRPVVYSRGRPTLNRVTNNKVTTTGDKIAANPNRSVLVFIEADAANTDFVLWGDEGEQTSRLNAGDVWPLLDVSPEEIWVKSNSGTQKVRFIGCGDPGR